MSLVEVVGEIRDSIGAPKEPDMELCSKQVEKEIVKVIDMSEGHLSVLLEAINCRAGKQMGLSLWPGY